MPRTCRGIFIDGLKGKKGTGRKETQARTQGPAKCQRDTECSVTFSQRRLRTVGRAELKFLPHGAAARRHQDRQWLVTQNKFIIESFMQWRELANEGEEHASRKNSARTV